MLYSQICQIVSWIIHNLALEPRLQDWQLLCANCIQTIFWPCFGRYLICIIPLVNQVLKQHKQHLQINDYQRAQFILSEFPLSEVRLAPLVLKYYRASERDYKMKSYLYKDSPNTFLNISLIQFLSLSYNSIVFGAGSKHTSVITLAFNIMAESGLRRLYWLFVLQEMWM